MRENKDNPNDCRPDPACGPGRRRDPGERVSDSLAKRVRALAFDALSPARRQSSELYLDPFVLSKGMRIGPSSSSWAVDRDCVLCFADHDPSAGFAHECSYYLHDARTGELFRRIPAEFPPFPMEGLHLLERFYQPVPPAKSFPLPPRRQGRIESRMERAMSASAPSGKRYAILFAGECDRFHVNDLELSYRTLIDTFKFNRANVIVLVHDGTREGAPFLGDDGLVRPWPGDNTAFSMEVKGEGTREQLREKLDDLDITENDLLFIHTAGHGGTSYEGGGEQFLRLGSDGSDQYSSTDLQQDLQQRLRKCKSLLVVMNQCFAGGFRDSILAAGGSKAQQTYFAAACGADARAHATKDRNFSRFALNWFEAERQHHVVDPTAYMPPTDDDHDGKVEASEAYDYCVYMNCVSTGHDSPVEGRAPAPDPTDHSPADNISLT